jgi:hypothetical protein
MASFAVDSSDVVMLKFLDYSLFEFFCARLIKSTDALCASRRIDPLR